MFMFNKMTAKWTIMMKQLDEFNIQYNLQQNVFFLYIEKNKNSLPIRSPMLYVIGKVNKKNKENNLVAKSVSLYAFMIIDNAKL